MYKTIIFLMLSISVLLFSASKSTIILPIEANLSHLETYLNDTIPEILSTINDRDKVCVKPQYLKTKGIPKCRMDNFKISCKEQWIKFQTISEIKCDIKGWVKKDGKLLVSGEGKQLEFSFPIKTEILVTSKHIDAVATAAATVHLLATPHINKDWSISIDAVPTFSWSKEPTVTLLNSIKISIKKQVEAKLQKRINKFMKKLPKRLAKIKLKEKVTEAWDKIQEPIKLDKHSETYLLFTPHVLSYSGFKIINNLLQTTLSIQGETNIVLGTPSKHVKKRKLFALEKIDFKKGGFTFNLPITISYNDLILMLNKKFEKGYKIDLTQSTLPGFITLSTPSIEKINSGQLQVSAHIHYDNNTTWIDNIDGTITFNGTPKLNKNNQTIILDNLSYSSKTNNDMFDGLVNISKLKPLQYYLSDLMTFELSHNIDKGITKANKALKSFSKKGITLSAKLDMASIEDLHLYDEKLTLTTKLSGVVNASIDLKPK